MITQKSIEEILSVARIEEVIGDFIALKRAGQNYKGLSPFANEKTPSFIVSPAKQIFKDFSSGKGGTLFTFLKEHERLNFPEAIRYLANKYNITLEETAQSPELIAEKNKREGAFILNERLMKMYNSCLKENEEGKSIAMPYLENRKISQEMISKFMLGYSPKIINHTSDYLKKNQFSLEIAEELEIIIKRNSGQYFDRFSERLVFPIFNIGGRVIGFGARILIAPTANNMAKYVNSKDSFIYNKSQSLYGIYQSKNTIAKQDNCYLVEGYTDVIAFHQKGIENVVASSGTALTLEQIRLIKRFSKNVTLLYDEDKAGINAANRAVKLLLKEGMNIFKIPMQSGFDPYDLAMSMDSEKLRGYLDKNTVDFLEYKFKNTVDLENISSQEKIKFVQEIIDDLSNIDDKIKQDIYIKDTAKWTNIGSQIIAESLVNYTNKTNKPRFIQNRNTQNNTSPTPQPKRTIEPLLEKDLLTFIINNLETEVYQFQIIENPTKTPLYIIDFIDTKTTVSNLIKSFLNEEDYNYTEMDALSIVIKKIINSEGEQFDINSFDIEEKGQISLYLNIDNEEAKEENAQKLSENLVEKLLKLRILTLTKKLQILKTEIAQLEKELNEDDPTLEDKLQQIMNLTQYRNTIASIFGLVL